MLAIADELKKPVAVAFAPPDDDLQKEWRFYLWASRHPEAVWQRVSALWREDRMSDAQAANIMRLSHDLVRRNCRSHNRRGYCILSYQAASRLCAALGLDEPDQFRPDWTPPEPRGPVFHIYPPPMTSTDEGQRMLRAKRAKEL